MAAQVMFIFSLELYESKAKIVQFFTFCLAIGQFRISSLLNTKGIF